MKIEELTDKLNKVYAKQIKYSTELNELIKDIPTKRLVTQITPVLKKEYPPEQLIKLLNLDENKKITRIDLGRKLIIYCRKKKLINNMTITCNDNLRKIFIYETLDVTRIQVYLDELYE